MKNWKTNLSHFLRRHVPEYFAHLTLFQERPLCLEGPSVYQPGPVEDSFLYWIFFANLYQSGYVTSSVPKHNTKISATRCNKGFFSHITDEHGLDFSLGQLCSQRFQTSNLSQFYCPLGPPWWSPLGRLHMAMWKKMHEPRISWESLESTTDSDWYVSPMCHYLGLVTQPPADSAELDRVGMCASILILDLCQATSFLGRLLNFSEFQFQL